MRSKVLQVSGPTYIELKEIGEEGIPLKVITKLGPSYNIEFWQEDLLSETLECLEWLGGEKDDKAVAKKRLSCIQSNQKEVKKDTTYTTLEGLVQENNLVDYPNKDFVWGSTSGKQK